MTARKMLTLILDAHGLTLGEDEMIKDRNTGQVLGELLTVKFDDHGGLRYSIKMQDALDYIDLDLDFKGKSS